MSLHMQSFSREEELSEQKQNQRFQALQTEEAQRSFSVRQRTPDHSMWGLKRSK